MQWRHTQLNDFAIRRFRINMLNQVITRCRPLQRPWALGDIFKYRFRPNENNPCFLELCIAQRPIDQTIEIREMQVAYQGERSPWIHSWHAHMAINAWNNTDTFTETGNYHQKQVIGDISN